MWGRKLRVFFSVRRLCLQSGLHKAAHARLRALRAPADVGAVGSREREVK